RVWLGVAQGHERAAIVRLAQRPDRETGHRRPVEEFPTGYGTGGDPSGPRDHTERLAVGRVGQPLRPFVGKAEEGPAVRGTQDTHTLLERAHAERAAVGGEGQRGEEGDGHLPALFAVPRAPEGDGVVAAGGDDRPSVRCPGQTIHTTLVC